MTGRFFSLRCCECKASLDRDTPEVLFADADRLGWATRPDRKTICFECVLKEQVKAGEYERTMDRFLAGAAK